MLPSYYRGCWHEVSRSFFSGYSHYPHQRKTFTADLSIYSNLLCCPRSCNITGSSFRPLSKIPHCWHKPRPCLSPSVADHPLRSAKDHRLGRLLPHQLPNPAQAHPKAILNLSIFGIFFYKHLQFIIQLSQTLG